MVKKPVKKIDKPDEETPDLEEFSSIGGGAIGGYSLPLGMKGGGDAMDSVFPWKKVKKSSPGKKKRSKKKSKKS